MISTGLEPRGTTQADTPRNHVSGSDGQEWMPNTQSATWWMTAVRTVGTTTSRVRQDLAMWLHFLSDSMIDDQR